jgi:hypothetical protein
MSISIMTMAMPYISAIIATDKAMEEYANQGVYQ